MKRLVFILPLLLLAGSGCAPVDPACRIPGARPDHGTEIIWQENADAGKIFETAGVRGTFVLYDAAAGRFTGHDRLRAGTRYLPASTFKIPNTLIAVVTGSVSGVDEVLPYGGKPQPIKTWEKDMSLRDAIRLSNVPVYQELARRTGLARMREGVARLEYGNCDTGGSVDTFWLKGPLKISAVEQTQFLARLAAGTLPLPEKAQAQVREIVQLERGSGWTLYGKTGWADSVKPPIGWWVGWVTRSDGRIYSFAINMDMPRLADAGKRIELGRACLKALGVFD